jgi:hypothetical protein
VNQYRAAFQAASPKPVDFLEAEYQANKVAIDAIAAEEGYRFAGVRLCYAVFTTKKTPHVQIMKKGA